MKPRTLIPLALALTAMSVMAQDPPSLSVAVKVQNQPQSPEATAKIPKTALHVVKPFSAANTETNHIDRVGNLSSRPWTQIVGWHSVGEFASNAERYHEPQFNLFWIGKEPQ